MNNIIDVLCGGRHTILIRDNEEGKIETWSFGDNRFGQLGLDDYRNRNLPVKLNTDNLVGISNGRDIKFNPNDIKVSCGGGHTILIDGNGNVWSFGFNEYGQLGCALSFASRNSSPVLR